MTTNSKTALITGGSSGIGLDAARGFLEEGYNVVIGGRNEDKLKQAIETFDFPWDRLELEITETSAVGNFVQASEFINYCRSKGIGFALDDFGTGMASFEYLKNLPFNVVKIDGSFVRDMLTDPVDHAMIRYTQDISQLRNQETIAEYVETEEEVAELKRIGITYGQGHYFGKARTLQDCL